MSPLDQTRLQHMLEAIKKIQLIMDGKTEQEFYKYFEINDVVTRELGVLGESSHMISDGFKHEHPSFPWRDMKDLRNRIIHNYDGVDLHVVYQVTQLQLPRLKEKLEYLKLPPVARPVLMPRHLLRKRPKKGL